MEVVATEDAAKETAMMPQLKGASLKLFDRCRAATASGGIPIPKEAQEALDRTTKLEAHIASLETMDDPEATKLAHTPTNKK